MRRALVTLLLLPVWSCAAPRVSEPPVAIDRTPRAAAAVPAVDPGNAAGLPFTPDSGTDAAAADAAAPDAAPPAETIDHWLGRHGVTAPSDPRRDICVPPNPCPADCVQTWTIAPSLDAIQCNLTASIIALARTDIVDHRTASNAVVYVATPAGLRPVLTVPISDVDIELTTANVKLYLHPSTDGLTLGVADDRHKCPMAREGLARLDRTVCPPAYLRTVAHRIDAVCGAVGTYRWNGKRYEGVPVTAQTP